MPKRPSDQPATSATRERILLEAEILYHQGGFGAINLQVIADRMSMTKAALFYYFSSKQSLFAALLEGMLERYDQMIRTSLSDQPAASEAQFLALSFALSRQPMFDAFRFLRSEQHHLSQEQQHQLQRSCDALLFRPIKRAFALALERDEIRKVNVGTASSLFLGFCVLASSLRVMDRGALLEADHKEMFAMFWRGVAKA